MLAKCLTGALAAVILAGHAAAATDAELASPVHAFIDAFNRGDAKTAAATHENAGVTIIDEVPPFIWTGPSAFDSWVKDLTANDAKLGISQEIVTLGEVTRTEFDGDRAYLVIKAVYTFKDHGKAMQESAQMAYALRRASGVWKISGWTWTGPKPTPAL